MRSKRLLVPIVAASVLLTGCGLLKKTSTPTDNDMVTKENPQKGKLDTREIPKVLYSEWTAMNVNGDAVKGEERPYVVFDTVATNPYLAKFYAYNGCNVINGTVAVTAGGSMKKASEYMSTMKFCPDAPYEIGVSMLLESLNSYKIEKIGQDYLLYLYNGDKKQSMVLRRSDLSWLNGAWKVRRIGDQVLPEDAGVQMVIDIPEKRIHGNTGCNILNGELSCNPDVQHSIRFTNMGTTRMMCPNIELEQKFLDALSQVSTAQSVNGSTNEADLRDANGTLLMELVRIDLKAAQTE